MNFVFQHVFIAMFITAVLSYQAMMAKEKEYLSVY